MPLCLRAWCLFRQEEAERHHPPTPTPTLVLSWTWLGSGTTEKKERKGKTQLNPTQPNPSPTDRGVCQTFHFGPLEMITLFKYDVEEGDHDERYGVSNQILH